jgi:hypothetical protein
MFRIWAVLLALILVLADASKARYPSSFRHQGNKREVSKDDEEMKDK